MIFNWMLWSEDGAVNMSSCLLHSCKHPQCSVVWNSGCRLPWSWVVLWDVPCAALRNEFHGWGATCAPGNLLSPALPQQCRSVLCPPMPLSPSKGVLFGKTQTTGAISSTKFLYHLKQSPAKLLLTMWIPADLSLCLACLTCLGCASSGGKLSVDLSSQSFLSQTWDSDTESKRVWWVHEWFLEDCWS